MPANQGFFFISMDFGEIPESIFLRDRSQHLFQ